MATSVLHVVPQEDHWAVKREGNAKASSTHETQKEAIDAARELAKEGDDLVIHRPDGTIRERITYTGNNGSNGNGSTANDKPKISAEDVLSVGSRVSWSAVLAGAVIGLAIYVTLSLLALAIGVSTVDNLQAKTFAWGAAVVMIFSVLVSLFVGGFIVSRTTVGENKLEALVYGVLVWGVMLGLMVVTGGTLGFGFGALLKKLGPNSTTPQYASVEKLEELGITVPEDKKANYEDAKAKAGEWIEGTSLSALSWWLFGGVILSIFAAVGGSISGAGPELVLKQIRDRRLVLQAKT